MLSRQRGLQLEAFGSILIVTVMLADRFLFTLQDGFVLTAAIVSAVFLTIGIRVVKRADEQAQQKAEKQKSSPILRHPFPQASCRTNTTAWGFSHLLRRFFAQNNPVFPAAYPTALPQNIANHIAGQKTKQKNQAGQHIAARLGLFHYEKNQEICCK